MKATIVKVRKTHLLFVIKLEVGHQTMDGCLSASVGWVWPLLEPQRMRLPECQDVLVWHVEETVGPYLSASELSLDLRPVAPGRGTETESADL